MEHAASLCCSSCSCFLHCESSPRLQHKLWPFYALLYWILSKNKWWCLATATSVMTTTVWQMDSLWSWKFIDLGTAISSRVTLDIYVALTGLRYFVLRQQMMWLAPIFKSCHHKNRMVMMAWISEIMQQVIHWGSSIHLDMYILAAEHWQRYTVTLALVSSLPNKLESIVLSYFVIFQANVISEASFAFKQ